MNQQVNNLIMNGDENMGQVERSPVDEQLFRKQRLAAALRIFGRFGFDEGVAGHITVRDPLDPETFWVNPMGRSFKMMRVSDLIRVDHDGNIVEGNGILNGAAFTIHSQIHAARPDVTAAAHAHSIYGKAWASLGRLGALLGRFRAVLEAILGVLSPLGLSWGPLGVFFGVSWTVTGLSWRPLGRSGGRS